MDQSNLRITERIYQFSAHMKVYPERFEKDPDAKEDGLIRLVKQSPDTRHENQNTCFKNEDIVLDSVKIKNRKCKNSV